MTSKLFESILNESTSRNEYSLNGILTEVEEALYAEWKGVYIESGDEVDLPDDWRDLVEDHLWNTYALEWDDGETLPIDDYDRYEIVSDCAEVVSNEIREKYGL